MKFTLLSKYQYSDILAFVEYMKCGELGKKPNLSFIAKIHRTSPYRLRLMLSDKELCNAWGILKIEAEKPTPEPPKQDKATDAEIEVLNYLNERTGKNFTPKNMRNVGFIRSRLNDGFALSQIKSVIDKKVQDWKGTQYDKYLRPETLFNKTKFENYINENTNEQRAKSGTIQSTANAISKAQSVDWGLD